MNRISLALLTFAFVIGLAFQATPAAAQATDWQKITIPPLPAFHPQEPKRIVLPTA